MGGLSKQYIIVWTDVPPSNPTIKVCNVPEGSPPTGPKDITSKVPVAVMSNEPTLYAPVMAISPASQDAKLLAVPSLEITT